MCFISRAKLISTTLALRTTSYLSMETEYLPWQSALDSLQYYFLMLDRTEVFGPMQVVLTVPLVLTVSVGHQRRP